MKQLFKHFIPYIVALIVMVAFIWGQVNINLSLPDYMSKIINQGIITKNMDKVWSNGLAMLLLTVVGGICTVIVSFIAAKISTGYVRRLREAVFMKVERFSLGEFDNFSTSSLITRTTNDMQQIQSTMAMMLRMVFMAPLMGIGSIIKAHQIAPSMSWIIIVSISVLVSLIVVLFIVALPKFSIIQKLVDKLSLQTREMLTGVRVIRAYNNDKCQQDKFDETNQESTRLNIFVNRLIMLTQPVMTMVMGLASMAVVWAGAYAINDAKLQVGDLLALMQYVMQTIMSFLFISMIFILIPRAAVSMRRVGEILAVEPSISDIPKPKHLPKTIRGVVNFDKVDFKYEGSEQSVLSDISFTAESGKTTAIIGGTGSGKSSILKLIPRLYDISGGSITIDGVDIRELPQSELHDCIGYVPQKALLFSGTVNSNIKYGKPKANESIISKAIRVAQAKEFVDGLPEKLDNSISQAGGNLSGGQKQRLSIARALAKDPQIYLFDDSFSALDFKTDSALRKALAKEVSGKTLIIVAQRISTIMSADKIIVLNDGKIVGTGTHVELLKSSKVYREIAESQLSAIELGKDK